MSTEKEKQLRELSNKMHPKTNNDEESFIQMLSPAEKEAYKSLIVESDREKFYDNIIRNRTSKLRARMNSLSVDKYMASDVSDITSESVEEYLSFKSAEVLEKELEIGMKEMQRHYTSKAMTLFVEKRNKINSSGKLDTYITVPESDAIKALVVEQLTKDPTYKLTSLFINNTAGSITLFNDKMIESKRDLETYKELYCNEKGMTPESFDNWQEYVKSSVKEECIDGESGFSNLSKFNKEWHIETLKKFFKKVPGFIKGETIVYESDLLKTIDEYDATKDRTAKNPITKAILLSLDEGISKGFDLDREPNERVVEVDYSSNPEVIESVKSRRALLKKRQNDLKKQVIKEPIEEEVKEDNTKGGSKPSESLFDMGISLPSNNIESVILESEVVEKETPVIEEEPIVEATHETPQITPEVSNSIDTTESHNESLVDTSESLNEGIIRSDRVVITRPDPSEMLKGFRNDKIEEKVIVNYNREPDTSLLRQSTLTDPRARMQLYKNSAVINGFRLYLPYSGYEVIVKKLQDKSRISYLFSLLQNTRDDISIVIEQEVFKIIYDCLEFPDMEYVSYVEFTKSLSEGDIPILMVTLAMTNIPENTDGRVILPITSLTCTNRECDTKNVPVEPIDVDLYDLFSKIYPLDKYVEDYKNKLKGFDTIQKAFRSGSSGRVTKLEVNDSDNLCKFTVLMSKPTIYKNYSVKNQDTEVNFELVKEDILDRPDFYAEKIGFDGLDDYIRPLTFSLFTEKNTSVASKIALLNKNIDEFTDEEIEDVRNEINNDVTPVTMINTLLTSNIESIKDLLKVCRFIDAVKISTVGNDPVTIAVIETHEKLIDLFRVLSDAPVSLYREILKKVKEVEDTFEFEHENVYYTSDLLKGRLSKEFVENFSRTSDDKYREYIKEQVPDITDEQIEQQINYRKDEFDYIKEGKCTCGNDTFYINYISIVFFSIFNRLGVVKD